MKDVEIGLAIYDVEVSAGNLAHDPTVQVLYELVGIVGVLAERVAALERTLQSRTEHLV